MSGYRQREAARRRSTEQSAEEFVAGVKAALERLRDQDRQDEIDVDLHSSG